VKTTRSFAEWANEKLEKLNSDCVVETGLPEVRVRIRKTMPGGKGRDEPIEDPLKRFEVEVHNTTFDMFITILEKRFLAHGNLAADLACLETRHFPILSMTVSPMTLFRNSVI